MVVKIGVMGCCVSDDIFRSPHNYKYWEDFEKSFIIARTSLISLSQKPIDVKREDLIITKETEYTEHNINCMYGDITKRFYDIMTKDIQYLVFDLFLDVFFGALITEKGIITNNYWHLPYTNFYNNLHEKKVVKPSDNLDEFMKLFKKYSPYFFNYMKDNYPNTKIILVSVRLMEYRTLEDGSVESFMDKDNPINKSLEILEKYVCENYDVSYVDFEVTSLDKNHIWGPGKVHYAKEYYQYSYRKILSIVKFDEINKKINELKIDNNELNKEELIHEISLIKKSNTVNENVQQRYNTEIDTLKKDNIKLKLKNDSLNSEINHIRRQLNQKENFIEEINDDKKEMSIELEEIKNENTKLKNTNDLMFNSTSWTITRPLRLLSNMFKKFLHK